MTQTISFVVRIMDINVVFLTAIKVILRCGLVSKGTHLGKKANPAGENSTFIFTVCVKSVLVYHFKFAFEFYMTGSKKFSKPTSKNGEISRFNLEGYVQDTLKISRSVLSIRIQSFERFIFLF